jgi:4a-hydroxytetrahydrobiopterin dehydratase
MSELKNRRCVPCQGGIPPLTPDEASQLLKQTEGWDLIESSTKIRRTFTFKNFLSAQAFAVKVGTLSESENHHPDIYLAWGEVCVKIWTHKIDGLTESDFVLAAKFDAVA